MSKIKHVSFLGKNSSDQRDNSLMEYWKGEGWSFDSVVQKIRDQGLAMKDSEFAWLYNMAVESQRLVNDTNLTAEELKEALTDLLIKVKRLNDVVNGSLDYDPDKASFASAIKVTYNDGTQEVFNEDINEQIKKKYHSTIMALDQAVTVIDAKLKYYKSSSSPSEIEGLDVPVFNHKSPRHKLVLLYELGLLKKIREDYSYLDINDLAKIIGLITGITEKETIKTFAKEIDAIVHNNKTSGKGGSPITNASVKAVRTALLMCGAKITRLPDL